VVTRRLLAVHAHPDDESSKGAATYAYYRSTGARVCVVSCTGGERGDVQNPGLAAMAMAERDMAGLRRLEMASAQQVLDIEHRWLGFTDSGLPEHGEPLQPQSFAMIPLELSAPPLVRVIREFRPHVVITYPEDGGYPHPDHIRTHAITIFAIEAAASDRWPELGAPWTVSKLYHDEIFSGERTRAVLAGLEARDANHPLLDELRQMAHWMSDRGSGATTRVECADFFGIRDEALRAHASQVPADSPFFYWPNDVQLEVWPFEEFRLAVSTIDTPTPETDLFAGITEEDAP
jgi:mycothiol S-conjugate amidase